MSLRKEMVELESELSEKPTAIIIGDLTLAREMTEEEKETIDLEGEEEVEEKEEPEEVDQQETTEGRIISTESIMKELTALKTHINSEWELSEQNTQTLVEEINTLKKDMTKMLKLIESLSETKVEL